PAYDPERAITALERARRLRRTSSGQRSERGLRSVPHPGLPRTDAGRLCLDRVRPIVGGRTGDVLARSFVGTWLLGPLVRGAGLSILRLSGRVAAVPGHRRGDLDAV